ncbi:hypothetical protein Ddye_025196 [Dipteronia dyeriana]|uniref:DUF4283 domain-containing protein n=1 Tax=Dipteronia dyeriana TaxID=168575 RepID=A0AAD9TX75_9ROSI|nr:hypothetical protein Ddye_025196 [Dipteronia dyeriana]
MIEKMSFKYVDFWVQIHQIPLLCMTKEFLGGMIGDVIDVDGKETDDCVGKFMRVRMRLEIDKSLRRCLWVDILGDGETVMVLKHEKIPNHCFKCGTRSGFEVGKIELLGEKINISVGHGPLKPINLKQNVGLKQLKGQNELNLKLGICVLGLGPTKKWTGQLSWAEGHREDLVGSDHRPLLDFTEVASSRNTCMIRKDERFFFEKCLSDNRECKEIVSIAWANNERGVNGRSSILNKIGKCGKLLRDWNGMNRVDYWKNIRKNNEGLRAANKVDKPFSWKRITVLEEKLDSALDIVERYCKERAKIDWLQNGDKNSRFFHS